MTLLHDRALQSYKRSYAPYTGHPGGAALKTVDGSIYSGSAFENAAYMHGLDPLESAIGTLLINENWIESQALPRIAAVHFCQDDKPGGEEHRDLPVGSLAVLRCFGQPHTTIIFGNIDGNLQDHYDLRSVLRHRPEPDDTHHDFLTFARHRRESTTPSNRFKTPALKQLFRTRLKAFDPVSRYAVAAMVETTGGEVFYGVNCEPGGNKALHAEAMALAAMINEVGADQTLSHITILTGGRPGFPCGGCRQYIREFSDADTLVTAMSTTGENETVKFETLLPRSFGPEDLRSGASR